MCKIHKSALLCGAAILAGALAPAQASHAAVQATVAGAERTGDIVGVVTDAARGGFLVGAEVRIEGLDVVGVTNSEGRYALRRAPEGRHVLVVTYVGRAPQRTEVVVAAGQATSASIALGALGADAATVDDIVVTASRPLAESEAAALQIQRSSTSLVNVVAADAIGRFPDQNIAAALSRLPGVAVERDQGQERYVNLRGAPSRWTTIAFDGVNVVSPGGRTARVDTIPAAIASQVQSRKAITAAMPGETLAGNINIITRGAFDYPGFKAAADLGAGYNELGGRGQYNAGGFVSNTFADGLFGVLLSASRYERNMITDNFETDWEVAPEDLEPGREDRVWAHGHRNKLYRLTRTNTAFSGRLDVRPSENHRFFLSSIYTEFTDDELRDDNRFDFDTNAVPTTDTRPQTTAQRTGYADIRTGNTPLRGVVHGVEMDGTQNINHTTQSIFTTTLGGEQRFGGWAASWRLNYTDARDQNGPYLYTTWVSPSTRTLRPTVEYDFTNRETHGVRLYQTVRNSDGSFSRGALKHAIDPQDYQFVSMRSADYLVETKGHAARLDLTRELDLFGRSTELRLGAQYDRRVQERNWHEWEVLPATLTAAGVAAPVYGANAINDPYKGELPLGYAFRYFSRDGAWEQWNGLVAQGASRVRPNITQQNYYKVAESIAAAYVMGTTYFDWGNLVAGVRVEHVENEGEANVQQSGVWGLVQVSDTNVQAFPSLHLNWDINSEMKLRLSANTGAARPDYRDLRPNFSISDTNESISGGNPSAGPEKAIGLDGYFEWYRPDGGFFSVGAYYKDLTDILFDVRYPRFGRDMLNTPDLDRSEYAFSTIANGGEGFIRGVEFAFSQTLDAYAGGLGLPAWAGGFGLRGNLTLNETKATTPDGREVGLPGASDLVYNIALSYERYGFSTRLSWQYRTEWLDSIGDGSALGDSYWDEVGRLDFSARYAVNDHAELYLDANNLLDEPGVRYQGQRYRVSEYEKFGQRIMVGVRLNF